MGVSPTENNGRRKARRIGSAALAAAVFAGTAMSISPAMAQDDDSTVTRGDAYNPLSPYSDFNIVSLGDLHIVAESEGPVAVGGQFSFDGSHTIVRKPGVPAGLVVKGGVDWAKSTGQHQVNQTNGNVTGSPLSVNLDGSKALDRDRNDAAAMLQVVPEAADYDNEPGIKVNDNGPQAENAGYDADKFDALFNENAAIGISEELDAQAESTCQAPNVIQKVEGENNLPESTEPSRVSPAWVTVVASAKFQSV
jgi:hypothetical protein